MIVAAVPQAAAVSWAFRLNNLRIRRYRPQQATNCSFTRVLPVTLNYPPRRFGLLFVPRAVDSTPPASASAASSGKTIVPDEDFSLSKISFGVIGLAVGGTLLSYGFGAYFTVLPGSEWSALMLTYGFPLAVIGMALKIRKKIGKILITRHLMREELIEYGRHGLGSSDVLRNFL